MKFNPIPLPYPDDALEPHISKRTLDLHYRKHTANYFYQVSKLAVGTKYEEMTLEEVVIESAKKKDTKMFDNSGQAYNHNILWLSMSPTGGGAPKKSLQNLIEASFETFESFKDNFESLAVSRFGSGWAWLSYDPSKNKLHLSSTSNAETPLTSGLVPLITIDVWEHAYYLDYQNRRSDYVSVFFEHLVNWEYASVVLSSFM